MRNVGNTMGIRRKNFPVHVHQTYGLNLLKTFSFVILKINK